MNRRLAAILVADVVAYSRLMEADEASTLAALKERRRSILAPTVRGYSGRIVKFVGDGVLIEFPSAVNAVKAALELQDKFAAANDLLPDNRRIVLRIGINLGDVIGEGSDIYGDGVNIAARLEALAEPGGVCMSGQVHDAVRGKCDYGTDDLGNVVLKNIERPVRAYRAHKADSVLARTATQALPLPSKPSIAVLPFQNMSGDPEQEYFADGVVEDIITALSRFHGLFVIARNSSFTYKGRAVDVKQVGRDMGVRYVLEGSVRKAGNRVRISAKLVDSTTGGHLWAERYDRSLTDIFALQDEIAGEIVSNLAITLTSDERRLQHRGPTNAEAYEHYLRGADELWHFSKETCAEARRWFETAIDLDPLLTAARTLLSHSHLLDYVNSWSEGPEQSLQWAHELADQAVAQDSDDGRARWQLGSTLLWLREHDRSIAELRRAIAISPSLATAYAALGRSLHFVAPSQESVDLIETAIRLNPAAGTGIWLHFLGESYFGLKRYDFAAAALKRRIIRQPDTDDSRVLLASCYGYLGQPEQAVGMWREALQINLRYSMERKRRILPYKNPDDFEHIVQGLRIAGLPE